MSDTQKEVTQEAEVLETQTPVTEGETEAELKAKETIYIKIDAWVKEKTGKRIGKTGGRVIFDLVLAEVFAAVARDGSFRLNGGFGSFHKKNYQAGERRLPSGQVTKFGEREKIRYEEGVVVRKLVEFADGDVQKAIEHGRGKRGASTEPKTADEAPAAKEPAPAPTPESEADVDLT